MSASNKLVKRLAPVAAGIILLVSCTAAGEEGFAIYLTRGDIPPAQTQMLSHVDIEGSQVISTADIISYNAGTHEIRLTAAAFERIAQLEVPVRGRSFVVCVDRAPIYWGAFWTPFSSVSFDGVTIWKPLKPDEPHVIILELGYPSSSFYTGDDPRNSPAVMRALERSGKLIKGTSPTETGKLPRSMKGYELYSWFEGGQWHFTLVTGTNRNKTVEEITAAGDLVSASGWVRIHVIGAEAIKPVLCRLQQGEEIFWLAGPRAGETPPGKTAFMLPPEETIDAIKKHATQCGLILVVTSP